METTLLRLQPYTDQLLEARYETVKNDLKFHLELQGKQDGIENKPQSYTYYQVQVLIPLKTTIQELIDFNYQCHQPISDIAVTKSIRSQAEEDMSVLAVKAKNAEKKYETLRNEHTQLCPGLNKMTQYLRTFIPLVFGLIEGLLTFTVLQSVSISPVTAIILSIGLAFISAWGLHLGAHYIAVAPTNKLRRKRHYRVLAIAGMGSIALALWRLTLYADAASMHSQLALETPSRNLSSFLISIPLIVLTFLIFVIALSFELRYWIGDHEKRKQQVYDAKTKELAAAKQEWADLLQQKKAIAAEMHQASGSVIQKQEYAKGFEQRLVALAHELCAHYESVNLDNRKDDLCPDFFGSTPEWGFTLYFTHLFTSKTAHQ